MKGLELARRYYNEFGTPMIHNNFPDLENKLAVGLVGEGSECFGYDDEVSQDHDFEPGFCIFIPDDTDSRIEFRLERAYAGLPKEFCGLKRLSLNPTGGSRRGVIKIGDFYQKLTGYKHGPKTTKEWLSVPDYGLSAAVNGEVFFDGTGEFSNIRKSLISLPDDIRSKKLSGRIIMMAQSGQYNYTRCLSHGETGSAQLALYEFVRSTIFAVFLLNNRYAPFYKWAFRALRELPVLNDLAEPLEFLITTDNSGIYPKNKAEIIEDISMLVIQELQKQNLSDAICSDLEKHAYSVNDKISDTDLRNKHIMAAI